jgi:hypothetical protein
MIFREILERLKLEQSHRVINRAIKRMKRRGMGFEEFWKKICQNPRLAEHQERIDKHRDKTVVQEDCALMILMAINHHTPEQEELLNRLAKGEKLSDINAEDGTPV